MNPLHTDYALLLRQCAQTRTLFKGKELHAHITSLGQDGDTYLGNLLVHMYGKCGDVRSACEAFDRIQEHNVFSWNMLIAAYAQNGYGRHGLNAFRRMAVEGVPPNVVTFIHTFSSCSAVENLAEGRKVHARVTAEGYEHFEVVVTSILNMYGKCGSLEDARNFFNRLPKKNVFAWNAMISGCVQNKQSQEGIKVYHEMESTNCELDYVTYVSVVTACASLGDVTEGIRAHEKIKARGFERHVDVSNCLVNMYGKCGNLEAAREMFDSIKSRNLGSWNAIIAAYAQNGQGKEALELYHEMDLKGIKLDQITLTSVIRACSSLGDVMEGRLIHGHAAVHGYESDVVVGTALLDMYSKCGRLEDARQVFEKIRKKDVICWTAMVAAYAQAGLGKEALEVYWRMDCPPGKMTLTSILAACAANGALKEGKFIHEDIRARRLEIDVAVGNALINLYGKCSRLELARDVFDNMRDKDLITWNTMISLYARAGPQESREALQLYKRMEAQGMQLNDVTFVGVLQACVKIEKLAEGREVHEHILRLKINSDLLGTALFNMYSRCGSLEDARGVFQELCLRDVVSWTAMIQVYAQHGRADDSLIIFREMYLDGVVPNLVTFVNMLHACNHAGLLDDGLQCFMGMIQDHGMEPTQEVCGCMVDLVARAGWLDEAEELISLMPFEPDYMVWTSLLGACKAASDMNRAERLMEVMSRKKPPYSILANMYTVTSNWERLERRMEQRAW